MVALSYTEKELNIDEKAINFPHPIADVLTVNNLVLVLLEIPNDEDNPKNIVAITMDGQILWKIDTPTEGNYNQPYHFIRTENGKAYATNWDGYEYVIDLDSGAVERNKKVDK